MSRRVVIFSLNIVSILFCAFLSGAGNCRAEEIGPVRVQLKWTHQYQFAGYYIALHKGYYRDAGLNVELLEGGPSVNVSRQVLSGEADFGIGTSELLLDYVKGQPVVVLGVIYQHSPLALMIKTDDASASPEQLIGKRIMIESHAADLMAMFKRQGIHLNDLNIVHASTNSDSGFYQDIAASSIYLTDEPYTLQQKSISHIIMTPRSYGIDFYGDNLFTTRRMLQTHQKTVEAFCDATFRGWKYAMAHPEETVDLILEHYPNRKTREHLLFEARETERLMTRLVSPGFMLKDRWEHIASTYMEVGMIDHMPPLDKFLYRPRQNTITAWIQKLFPIFLGVLLFAVFLIIYFFFRATVFRRRLAESELLRLRQNISEEEKRANLLQKILRDIHDGLGGLVANLSTMPALALRESNPAEKDKWILQIERTAQETRAEISELMGVLESRSVTFGEIVDSTRQRAGILFNETQTKITFHLQDIPGDCQVGAAEGLSICRMIRECLNNIVKHADAANVEVHLYTDETNIHIDIQDDGCGFDPAKVSRGRGLNNLESRAAELGGCFTVTSATETIQAITIPLTVCVKDKSTSA